MAADAPSIQNMKMQFENARQLTFALNQNEVKISAI